MTPTSAFNQISVYYFFLQHLCKSYANKEPWRKNCILIFRSISIFWYYARGVEKNREIWRARAKAKACNVHHWYLKSGVHILFWMSFSGLIPFLLFPFYSTVTIVFHSLLLVCRTLLERHCFCWRFFFTDRCRLFYLLLTSNSVEHNKKKTTYTTATTKK